MEVALGDVDLGMCLDSQHSMPTNLAVSSAVTPWVVNDTEALLDRFLKADLSRHDAATWIRALIGGSVLGSREYGRWTGRPDRTNMELLRDYASAQKYFRTLIQLQGEVVSRAGASRDREELRAARRLLGRRLHRLVDMLDDVRLDFVRETWEGGPAEHDDLRRLLIAFGRTSTRRIPLRLELISESLIGQLALAMAERLCGARQSGRCLICGEVWLSRDNRGHRKLCGKTTCATAWRQQRRKPEPPEKVRRRVAKHRAGSEAKP